MNSKKNVKKIKLNSNQSKNIFLPQSQSISQSYFISIAQSFSIHLWNLAHGDQINAADDVKKIAKHRAREKNQEQVNV